MLKHYINKFLFYVSRQEVSFSKIVVAVTPARLIALEYYMLFIIAAIVKLRGAYRAR